MVLAGCGFFLVVVRDFRVFYTVVLFFLVAMGSCGCLLVVAVVSMVY